MIKISDIRLKPGYTNEHLTAYLKNIGLNERELAHIQLLRSSIDARKKPDIVMNLSVAVASDREEKLQKRIKHATVYKEPVIPFSHCKDKDKKHPVLVGAGPAGLFCAYYLARYGYEPVLIERGKEGEKRLSDIRRFWEEGRLDPESNVLFGEGGAGTFSDGKLNCSNKDPYGYQRQIFKDFVRCGADEGILTQAKPHIGTDGLIRVVKNLREEIKKAGGSVEFETKVTKLRFRTEKDGRRICGVACENGRVYESNRVILAVGHSARDLFLTLKEQEIAMEAKPFAVGYRISHLQKDFNLQQYGAVYADVLPPADYKLVAHAKNGRNVFSFCMCPGGYVVNASSVEGQLNINGMSYQKRDSENANSAIIMSVTPLDYPSDGPLSGIRFQEKLERNAFQCASGAIPFQTLEDYMRSAKSSDASFGRIYPVVKGAWAPSNLRGLLPMELEEAFLDGMEQFGTVLPLFSQTDALLAGIEARTSSPLRILRNDALQAVNCKGLYPCGEGAGYAGGITSAAVDGLKVALQIMNET